MIFLKNTNRRVVQWQCHNPLIKLPIWDSYGFSYLIFQTFMTLLLLVWRISNFQHSYSFNFLLPYQWTYYKGWVALLTLSKWTFIINTIYAKPVWKKCYNLCSTPTTSQRGKTCNLEDFSQLHKIYYWHEFVYKKEHVKYIKLDGIIVNTELLYMYFYQKNIS